MLIDLKGQIDNNTIIVQDFNTPLSIMDRSSTQNIKKETEHLSNTIGQTQGSKIHSSQTHMNPSSGRQVLANLRRLKSYHLSFLVTCNKTKNQ